MAFLHKWKEEISRSLPLLLSLLNVANWYPGSSKFENDVSSDALVYQ